MGLSLLVFDCDGVILESVDAKTRAYARVGLEFGQEAADRLVAHYLRHGGVGRDEKFAWLFREVLDRELSPERLEELKASFVRHSLDRVMNCITVPGILDVLQRWRGRVPMYVASGAPHDELGRILAERGLDRYFVKACGSPPGKTDLLRAILAETGASPHATVMVGDSAADQHAAERVGALFYGRGEYFRYSGHPWHHDLTRLNAYLEAVHADEV